MKDIKKLSETLDTKFKIGPIRFGLDSLIGFVPGIGDVISSLLSLYIVFRAFMSGLDVVIIFRMLVNVLIDTVIGSIPLVGDVFDIFWKSNQKNLRLFENGLKYPLKTKKYSKITLITIALLAVFFLITVIYLITTIILKFIEFIF